MNLKVGDKVRFLNDVGGGVLTRFIDKETAAVLTEDGFELPSLIDELLKIEQYEAISGFESEKKETAPVTQSGTNETENFDDQDDTETDYEKETDDINIYLAFVPQDSKKKEDGDLDLFLINDSNYLAYYNFALKQKDVYVSKSGKIEPNIKIQIDSYRRDRLKDIEKANLQMLFTKKDVPHDLKPILDKELSIRSSKFYLAKSYVQNDFFYEDAILMSVWEEANDGLMDNAMDKLTDKFTKKISAGKEQKKRPRISKSSKNTELVEIDLHIHELIDDETGLERKEILEIQLSRFHNEMETAIKNNAQKIVFIHGVGQGVLKLEISKELKSKYKKYRYQDASFREYGYGATMIYLQNN